jgi:drug/metabolite transporter (DMT)-like permease
MHADDLRRGALLMLASGLLFSAMGALASLAQLLLTRAYSHAPAAQVGPFTYSTVVFAAAIGWIFWGEIPDLLSFGGTALVCLAGIMTIRFAGQRLLSEARLAK